MKILRSYGASTIAACLNATRQEGILGHLAGDRPEAIVGSDMPETEPDNDFSGEQDISAMEKG